MTTILYWYLHPGGRSRKQTRRDKDKEMNVPYSGSWWNQSTSIWTWTEMAVKWMMPSRFPHLKEIHQKTSRNKGMLTVAISMLPSSTVQSHWLHCQCRVLLSISGALSVSFTETKASASLHWCYISCIAWQRTPLWGKTFWHGGKGTLDCPLCFTEMNSCDFNLFSMIKKHLRGKWFRTMEEIMQTMAPSLATVNRNIY